MAVARWDFTIWNKDAEIESSEVKEWLDGFSKRWCFQAEDAGSGKHYQGRISLKVKSRKCPLKWGVHWSKSHVDDDFYVSKVESRIDGPWKDDDIKIPRQIIEISELYNWQKDVISISRIWDSRHINVIIDHNGCVGKSVLVGKMCCELRMARKIPPLDSYKDLMCLAYSMPESRCYLVDMPRALDKSKQEAFYSAIESVKDGHIWDNRYSYKEKWIDSPVIWLFTNDYPNMELLSRDRWKLYKIVENNLKALRCNTYL